MNTEAETEVKQEVVEKLFSSNVSLSKAFQGYRQNGGCESLAMACLCFLMTCHFSIYKDSVQISKEMP